MKQPIGEHTPVILQGVLVLKLTRMKQFRAKTLGDEGNVLRNLCKMVTRGNRMLIDPIRRLTYWMWKKAYNIEFVNGWDMFMYTHNLRYDIFFSLLVIPDKLKQFPNAFQIPSRISGIQKYIRIEWILTHTIDFVNSSLSGLKQASQWLI